MANEQTIEKRVEKIENWLMFEGGNFYVEMTMTLIRYAVFFFLGYILLNAMTDSILTVILEQLPAYCESIK